jgi:hypothetical protein
MEDVRKIAMKNKRKQIKVRARVIARVPAFVETATARAIGEATLSARR